MCTDLSSEERLSSFPVKVLNPHSRDFAHAFISVKPSIGLPDLMEKVLSALKPELLQDYPKRELEKASVELLTVYLAGYNQDLDFPMATPLRDDNCAAILEYLATSRGYDYIEVVLNDRIWR